jgi:hypothetical protein
MNPSLPADDDVMQVCRITVTLAISLVGITTLAPTLWGQSPATRPSDATTTVAPSESAGSLLDRMLPPGAPTARPVAPATAATPTTRPGVAPGTPAHSVLREGTLLVDRTGRLARSADGSNIEFVFDSDGTALKDPPVIILPNLKLLAMEQAVAGVNRDLRFRITGMVTEYRGRNYVLLDKVVVVPDQKERL